MILWLMAIAIILLTVNVIGERDHYRHDAGGESFIAKDQARKADRLPIASEYHKASKKLLRAPIWVSHPGLPLVPTYR